MDKKLTKKMAAGILIAFVLIMALIFFLLSKVENHFAKSDEAATEVATEKTSEIGSTDGSSNGSTDKTVALGGSTEDTSDSSSGTGSSGSSDTFDSTGMSTEERNQTAALLASDIFIDTTQGEQSSSIGRLNIGFHSDYAYGASLSVSGLTMDAVLYHDGDDNDLKGLIGNVPLFKNVSAPNTEAQCKKILEEYIPDGTGRTSDWEETDGFFVRKISGYDVNDSCGVVYYTVIPKEQGDSNLYAAVLTASKADGEITPISKESFHSMIDPLSQLVPNSKLINTDYESSISELEDIAYYETAKADETFSGLYQLRKAARNWTETVYGTDDPSTLTEEERKDKYWQYLDPEGYREAKYYEAQEKAAEAAHADSGEIESEESPSSESTEESIE